MSKRFTDTQIWSKPWFRKLSVAEKTAWSYLKDCCDNVGVWDADFELAEFCIGEKIDWNALLKNSNGNIKVLDKGKWWLVDFCDFQYGQLQEDTTNKAHLSYVSLLKKHGLWEEFYGAYMGHGRGMDAPQDKDKEEDKDKEKKSYAEAVTMSSVQYDKLVDRFGNAATRRAIEKLSAYKLSKGKRYKSDYHAILQWVIEAIGAEELIKKPPKICPKCGEKYIGSGCTKCGWSKATEEAHGAL